MKNDWTRTSTARIRTSCVAGERTIPPQIARALRAAGWAVAIACALLLVAPGIRSTTAFAACTVPNQITNGQTSDASQVMSNFNALASCLNNVPAGSTGAVQYNAGGGSFGAVGPLANGQLVIGSSSGSPQAATLTAGSGVTITNGNGSITIAAPGSGGATPTIVQSAFARVATNTTGTLTLSAAPTVGNYLVLISSGLSGITNSVAPNFVQFASSTPVSNQGISIAIRKVQTGDGTSWATQNTQNGGGAFALLEVSNLSDISLSSNGIGSSGATLTGIAGARATDITIGVFESDQTNSFVSLTGASLMYDGTSDLGSGTNHPSVFTNGITSLSVMTVSYATSNFGAQMFSSIVLYGP